MISILVATSGRPEMLRHMLESLRQTTQGWDIEVIAVIDDDEKALEIANLWDVHVVDYSLRKRGALKSWNIALFLSDGDYIVPAGDDQVFHDGWLEYALESHKNKLGGYGVVGMNDLAYNGNTQIATMFMFDRQYCKDHMGGIFAPPMYHYYCIDSEWNDKARLLGKFYWDERSKVEHLHSAHGKRPIDDLDREKLDAGWSEVDNKTFQERKAQGFPVTWQAVI